MMLPMSYQLWKQVILSDAEKQSAEVGLTDTSAAVTLKKQLRCGGISK